MVDEPVRHRLDQHTSSTFNRSPPSLADGTEDRKDVIPVHTDRVDTVTRSTSSDTISVVLFTRRSRDRKTVITANE